MTFRRSDLQEAFSIAGTDAFRVWRYGTTDTLDEVLRPGYLSGGRTVVQPGDLIWMRRRPYRIRPDEPEIGERRTALVMVMVSGYGGGDASLRLVQGFGRPEGEAGVKQAGAGPRRRPGARIETRRKATARPHHVWGVGGSNRFFPISEPRRTKFRQHGPPLRCGRNRPGAG